MSERTVPALALLAGSGLIALEGRPGMGDGCIMDALRLSTTPFSSTRVGCKLSSGAAISSGRFENSGSVRFAKTNRGANRSTGIIGLRDVIGPGGTVVGSTEIGLDEKEETAGVTEESVTSCRV